MSGKEKLQTFVGWKRTVDVCLTYQIAFSYEVVTERSWQFLVSQCTNRKKRAELPISVEQSTARHGHSGGHKELSWIWVSPVSILKEHVKTMTNSSKPKKGLPNGSEGLRSSNLFHSRTNGADAGTESNQVQPVCRIFAKVNIIPSSKRSDGAGRSNLKCDSKCPKFTLIHINSY